MTSYIIITLSHLYCQSLDQLLATVSSIDTDSVRVKDWTSWNQWETKKYEGQDQVSRGLAQMWGTFLKGERTV